MTYHPQKGRGYSHVTVLKFFAVCRDAARRAGSSATAELLVLSCPGKCARNCHPRVCASSISGFVNNVMFSLIAANWAESDNLCFVEFATRQHRKRSLMSKTAFYIGDMASKRNRQKLFGLNHSLHCTAGILQRS